ncbi:MAG: aminopeptidase P family protein [Rhodothermales bacterium]
MRGPLLQSKLQNHQVDAAFITFLPDIRWACDFTGSHGVLVALPDGLHFVSDGRYKAQASKEVRGAAIHIAGHELFQYIAETNLIGSAHRILFQAEHVTVAQLEKWKTQFPTVEWLGIEHVLMKHVAAKTEEEVERIRKAQAITDGVFDHLLNVLRPGLSECEVAAEIVYQHLRRGADKMSFEPIVASGAQGALPHARPTEKLLASGEMIVLDFGCVVDGYASDMTRTIALGEPGTEAKKVYQVVLDAQLRALETARAGLSSKVLDEHARSVIRKAGFGDYFNHGLGHGIGLQTHEWPRISYRVDEPLPAGAVVTIEPGVYLPGKFGVRIEDMVVLREEGSDNLTRSPKALISL